MEPTFLDIIRAFALALWPVWVVLVALLVVRLASRLGYCAPDEYEEPISAAEADAGNREYLQSARFCCGEVEIGNPACPGCPFRADKYHGDDSWGR